MPAIEIWSRHSGQIFHHMQNSTERGDFMRFYAYICHVIDDFACFEWQHQDKGKKLTGQDFEQLFIAQELTKKNV